MVRGTLRVYLGAAPGVGKTFAMLGEGCRRAARGTDVVIAVVEHHGRAKTLQATEGLEVVPRTVVEHRGAQLTELDLAAVLARRPQVALVDELAHTNAPGSVHEKRWQDVEALLDAGIDVVSTVNVQHLESLNDVVERITGVVQRETVPDAFVRSAEQIELVDMSPEALRRRMSHGNVYPAERVDAALSHYFRVGNLTALRELALLWLADRVEEGLKAYRQEQGIAGTWETRERVVVALTGGAEGDTLIRRAARIANRQGGGDLLAVYVSRSDGLQGASPTTLSAQRLLVESLGGSYHVVVGDDVPAALLDFARSQDATQLVLGASRRGRLASLLGPGTGQRTVRASGSIDVHLVTHEHVASTRRLPELTGGLTRRRRALGFLTGAVVLPLLTLMLTAARDELSLGSGLLLYLTAVVGVALVGGAYPALVSAISAALLVNWFLTPPLLTLSIASGENVLALVVFVLVAAAVSTVVGVSARRARQAARATAEAETLATLSGDVLRGERTLPALIGRARELFALEEVSLIETVDGVERLVERSGAGSPEAERTRREVSEGVFLELVGRPVAPGDLRVMGAFAAQAAVSVERGRLARQAREAESLTQVDRMRTALLAAVGHDLRTPLSAAKAAVTSLSADDIVWTPAQRADLLDAADQSLDRLDDLIANLLDLSRLQAGVLAVDVRRASVHDCLPRAELAALGDRLLLEVPDALPEVAADPGLLERVLGNLLDNAARYSPAGTSVRLSADRFGDEVVLRVVDRGRGIAAGDRERLFAPFQRQDDRSTSSYGAGVGLGLAVARGFTEAMGGTLTVDDTPGGGTTMSVALPVAA